MASCGGTNAPLVLCFAASWQGAGNKWHPNQSAASFGSSGQSEHCVRFLVLRPPSSWPAPFCLRDKLQPRRRRPHTGARAKSARARLGRSCGRPLFTVARRAKGKQLRVWLDAGSALAAKREARARKTIARGAIFHSSRQGEKHLLAGAASSLGSSARSLARCLACSASQPAVCPLN